MKINNVNTTTVSNIPTGTANAEQPVTTTSAAQTPTYSCITYTAVAPNSSTSVTATPSAINTDIITPSSTANIAYAPRPNNNCCPTTNVVGSNSPTETLNYNDILKQVEEAFWNTDLGRDTQKYIDALENGTQDILDELEKKFSSNSILTATSIPTKTSSASFGNVWGEFDYDITNGGLKNLGVSAGFYGNSSYIEAMAQVRGFSVQAGAKTDQGSIKISTSDFRQYCFGSWINNVCGGNWAQQ